jgi:hypothetical protein
VFESAQRLARLVEELKERFSRRDLLVQHRPSRPLPSSREQPAPQPVVLNPRLVVKVRRVGIRNG